MSTALEALHGCLKESEGASFREIRESLADRLSGDEVAKSLAEGIHDDQVGLRFEPSPAPTGTLRFFLREEHRTPACTPEVTQMLAEYIRSKEDFNYGSPDVMVDPRAIYRALNEHQGVAFDALSAAFQQLFAERVLTFCARPQNDYITFTLDRNWQYTVLAYTVKTDRARCFHVRAGNQDIAEAKVRRIDSQARIVAVAKGAVGVWASSGEERLAIEVV